VQCRFRRPQRPISNTLRGLRQDVPNPPPRGLPGNHYPDQQSCWPGRQTKYIYSMRRPISAHGNSSATTMWIHTHGATADSRNSPPAHPRNFKCQPIITSEKTGKSTVHLQFLGVVPAQIKYESSSWRSSRASSRSSCRRCHSQGQARQFSGCADYL
jgi:hypothetical protein